MNELNGMRPVVITHPYPYPYQPVHPHYGSHYLHHPPGVFATGPHHVNAMPYQTMPHPHQQPVHHAPHHHPVHHVQAAPAHHAPHQTTHQTHPHHVNHPHHRDASTVDVPTSTWPTDTSNY